MARKPKAWLWGLVGSVLLHLLIVASVTFYFFWSPSVVFTDGAPAAGASGGGQSGADPRGRADAGSGRSEPDVQALMDQQQKELAAMSHEERMAELRKLDRIPERSVKDAAAFIEGKLGLNGNRKYAPDPKATGRFDVNSAVVYDIRKKQAPDGRATYVYVFVDRDGRTVESEVPDKSLSANDRLAAGIMGWARKDPKLRRLVDTVIKIGEKRTREAPGPTTRPAGK